MRVARRNVRVGAQLKQLVDEANVALHAGNEERSVATAVDDVHASAGAQQPNRHFGVPVKYGQEKRVRRSRITPVFQAIDIDTRLAQQHLHVLVVAEPARLLNQA